MECRKHFHGKPYYWYGWDSSHDEAIKSEIALIKKGDLVELERGVSKYPNSTELGWNTWRRKA